MTQKQFKPSISERIQGLDELRGISILMVMVCHVFDAWHISIEIIGPLAVDVFFIISGYLIGTILLKTRNNDRFFRTFYVRRVFRIWPLMFAMILLGIAQAVMNNEPFLRALPYYATFTQNFIPRNPVFPVGHPDFLDHLPGCLVMWSLAIEEQFYLTAPVFVRYLGKNRITLFFFSIAVISLTFRFLQPESNILYTNIWISWCRIHYIALGFLLACSIKRAYLAIFFAYWAALLVGKQFYDGILELPLALIAFWAVVRCIDGRPLIANRLLAGLGKICFGLYLLHWPLFKVAAMLDPGMSLRLTSILMCLAFLAAIGAAILSARMFELPIQRLRVYFE